VEGVATRLRQHLAEQDVVTVDARQADVLKSVVAAQPSVVILDATDVEAAQACSVGDLLKALPSLKIVRLDPQQKQIQVVVSEQRVVDEVRDLIDVIGLGEIAKAEEQSREEMKGKEATRTQGEAKDSKGLSA
jgi:anti-anti-sigma regulatory factor